jgi:predicted glycoside hydrolase/deacetylase ChbG (UPF0249 family)
MDGKTVRIVFRADDAGSCESANLAIAEAIAAGTVKNVSLMVCGPAAEHAVALLKHRDDIDVGLHVTLNAEWANVKWCPVLPGNKVSTLLEPGETYFTASPRLLKERGALLDEAAAEAEAQLARARALGLKIAYIDEHMGVGSLPGLRAALKDLAHREGIPHLDSLGLKRLPTTADVRLVDRWLAGLESAAPGTYTVVTHPGRIAPDMEVFFESGGAPGIIAAERDAERHALTDPALLSGLDQLGVENVRFSDLLTEE